MNNFNYYYLPTMPNNKLSNLLSVIDSISLSEKITIITKNINQSVELYDFFKSKGIISYIIKEKNDLEVSNNNDAGSILIVTYDTIALLKDSVISYVISLFSSISLEELKEKANLCHLKEKLILIELVSKFDFQFIQTLYKFSEIIVERFALLDNEKMIENKNQRVLSFLKTAFANNELLKNEYSLSSKITDLINGYSLEDIKSFFTLFFSFAVSTKVPALEFVQAQTKGMKEFKVVISQGYLDAITDDSLKDYFLKIPGILSENMNPLIIDEKETTIIFKAKDLNKNDISTYLLNNTYLDTVLEASSIDEKLIEEMGKFGETNSDSYNARRDNKGGSYQRRDSRDSSSGHQRREGGGYQRRDRDGGSSSGGGYQRRDRGDGSSYQRRDRDGGSGYQRRDSFSPRSSYNSGGAYDKYKSYNNSSDATFSANGAKDNAEGGELKRNNYGKSNYSSNSYSSNSSYGDKKPYRSFSSDFGAGDYQNSGKDRSGYDNKRKDFRSDRRSSGSSYGGGYKKSYERSSSRAGGGYNSYSKDKDRYSKGGDSDGYKSNYEDSDSGNNE